MSSVHPSILSMISGRTATRMFTALSQAHLSAYYSPENQDRLLGPPTTSYSLAWPYKCCHAKREVWPQREQHTGSDRGRRIGGCLYCVVALAFPTNIFPRFRSFVAVVTSSFVTPARDDRPATSRNPAGLKTGQKQVGNSILRPPTGCQASSATQDLPWRAIKSHTKASHARTTAARYRLVPI